MSGPYTSLPKPWCVFWISASLIALALNASSAFAAATIKILHGSDQQTTYGSAFPAALAVWVTDPIVERGVSGVRVAFTSSFGIGLSSSYAITDEYGLASVTATGLAPCNSEVSAEVSGVPGTRVTFERLVVNKAPLLVVPGDLKSLAGSPIPAASSYSFKGFVNGDSQETAQITGMPILSTTATDRSPHANYAIKGGVGSLLAPNYSFVAGFGTLAILDPKTLDRKSLDGQSPDGPNSGNNQQEASVDPSAAENGAQVRAALVGQLESLTMVQPNFIAGLRGQSGVFVRDAIWQNPASSAHTQSLQTQTANQNLAAAMAINLPTVASGLRSNSDAPVRSVTLPRLVTSSAIVKTNGTRSAIPAAIPDSRKSSELPVRAAITSKPSTVPAAQYSYTGSAIRDAFNSPEHK
jgi:hypothetical protein